MALKIIVNGKTMDCVDSHLTYEKVVELADDTGQPSVAYSAWLSKDVRKSGTMHATSEPVEVYDGMHFTVMHTGNA